MGDWWIDDAPPSGPRHLPSIKELLDEAFAGLAEPFRVVGRTFGKSLTSEMIDELANQIRKAELAVASYQPIVEEMHDFQDQEKKRLTGKGIVPHCGPRSSTTFGHGGRKNY